MDVLIIILVILGIAAAIYFVTGAKAKRGTGNQSGTGGPGTRNPNEKQK